MIVELKSDALKERHWKQLMRKLRVEWVLSDLTLGQVWDVDLQMNEAILKEIILTAQGEMALEEFLRQVISFPKKLVCAWNVLHLPSNFLKKENKYFPNISINNRNESHQAQWFFMK